MDNSNQQPSIAKGFLSKKLIVVVLVISLMLNLILALYFFKATSVEKNLNQKLMDLEKQFKQNQQNSSQSTSFYPQELSQKKKLTIGKRSNEVNVNFENSENITYDEIKYSFKGNDFVQLKINLSNKDINGEVQKFNTESDSYLDFVYEGASMQPLATLFRELEQNLGIYPRSIYNNAYEIFTNKNKIKMKRQYYLVLGYLEYEVEFIVPISYDVNYRSRYYSFTTSTSVAGKNFDETEFYKDPIAWIKRNPQKAFQDLDNFVDTIGY